MERTSWNSPNSEIEWTVLIHFSKGNVSYDSQFNVNIMCDSLPVIPPVFGLNTVCRDDSVCGEWTLYVLKI